MKRFEKMESYVDDKGICLTTYELNNTESVRNRIGMVIQKTYLLYSNTKKYAGCKHMTQDEAIEYIEFCLENGDKKID